jgi:AraC-like DNA-binding protein
MRSERPDGRDEDAGVIGSGAVGQRLGDLFKIDNTPALLTRRMNMPQLAVTEIRSDDPVIGVMEPVPLEDAYLVSVILRQLDRHEVWEGGRPCPRHTIGPGEFFLRDLKRGQGSRVEQPHHSLQFYLSRAALDDIALQEEARPIGELNYQPGVPIRDPVVAALGVCLRHPFERPDEADRLFLDHVTLALGIHLACAYGGLVARSRPKRGGLTGRQERLAKEALSAGLTLAEIAAQSGLSTSHFARAFRETVGIAPHQWLIRRRVDAATEALKDRGLSLAEVAVQCGFADQSHFTRLFSRVAGVSPGAWRREHGIDPPTRRTDRF